jgi:RNA polymerase sigma-70 factor (ECF subfamily)
MASRPEDFVDMSIAGPGIRPVKGELSSVASEDQSVVEAARDGDRTAFGRLYDRYARMVHGVLLAKVPAGEVDDLVQDVFVLALRRLSSLRETGSFGAWLAAIARNRAHDYHRRSVPEEPLGDDATGSIETENAKRTPPEQAGAILDAVRKLPEAYRETLILRLVEGMTGPEIAARTGLTHGSVRVNLHRGMQQLRATLGANPDEQHGEEEKP